MNSPAPHPYAVNHDDADCVSESSASSNNVSFESIERANASAANCDGTTGPVLSADSIRNNNLQYSQKDTAGDEVRWWDPKGKTDLLPNPVFSEAVQGNSSNTINRVTTFNSSRNSENSGSDVERRRNPTDAVSQTPPRPFKQGTTTISTTTGGASHPYASESPQPAPQRVDSPSPNVSHRRTSSVASNHSDRPPRHPSEERNMAAVWMDVPVNPPLVIAVATEPHRRRTPRRSSGPPSPSTSTLAASFSSSVNGEQGRAHRATPTSFDHSLTTQNPNNHTTRSTPTNDAPNGAAEVTNNKENDRDQEEEELGLEVPSVSSVSAEISPTLRVQVNHNDYVDMDVCLTPPSPSSVVGDHAASNSATSPLIAPGNRGQAQVEHTVAVSEGLLREILGAYNAALSEIHNLKGEVSTLKRQLEMEKVFNSPDSKLVENSSDTFQTAERGGRKRNDADANEKPLSSQFQLTTTVTDVSHITGTVSSASSEGSSSSSCLEGDLISNECEGEREFSDDATLKRLLEAVARAHKKANLRKEH